MSQDCNAPVFFMCFVGNQIFLSLLLLPLKNIYNQNLKIHGIKCFMFKQLIVFVCLLHSFVISAVISDVGPMFRSPSGATTFLIGIRMQQVTAQL